MERGWKYLEPTSRFASRRPWSPFRFSNSSVSFMRPLTPKTPKTPHKTSRSRAPGSSSAPVPAGTKPQMPTGVLGPLTYSYLRCCQVLPGESVRVRTGGPTYPGRGRHRHGPQSFTRFLFIASRLEGASVAGEASDVFRRWNRKFCQSFCRGEGFLMGKRGRGRTRCATVRGRVRVSEEREATMS